VVEHPVRLVVPRDALPEVVAPLQRPERPVQVEVGDDGGGAAVVAVVVGVGAAVVDAELAEDDGPAPVEQVERAAGDAGRDARARLVGVPGAPLLAVGEAVQYTSNAAFPAKLRFTGRELRKARSLSKLRPERMTSTRGFAACTASAPRCMYLRACRRGCLSVSARSTARTALALKALARLPSPRRQKKRPWWHSERIDARKAGHDY